MLYVRENNGWVCVEIWIIIVEVEGTEERKTIGGDGKNEKVSYNDHWFFTLNILIMLWYII